MMKNKRGEGLDVLAEVVLIVVVLIVLLLGFAGLAIHVNKQVIQHVNKQVIQLGSAICEERGMTYVSYANRVLECVSPESVQKYDGIVIKKV